MPSGRSDANWSSSAAPSLVSSSFVQAIIRVPAFIGAAAACWRGAHSWRRRLRERPPPAAARPRAAVACRGGHAGARLRRHGHQRRADLSHRAGDARHQGHRADGDGADRRANLAHFQQLPLDVARPRSRAAHSLRRGLWSEYSHARSSCLTRLWHCSARHAFSGACCGALALICCAWSRRDGKVRKSSTSTRGAARETQQRSRWMVTS